MKYPKEWLEIAIAWGSEPLKNGYAQDAEELLDTLHKAGALKDPPEPREWVLSHDPEYGALVQYRGPTILCGEFVRVREVTEEE